MDGWNLSYLTSADRFWNGAGCRRQQYDYSTRTSDASAISWGLFRCYICDVSGSGLDTYEEHLNGEMHMLSLVRVELKKIYNLMKERNEESDKNERKRLKNLKTSQGRQFDMSSAMNYLSNGNQYINSPSSCRSHDKSSVYFCYVCNVKISGALPFFQHLVGKEHKQREPQKVPDDKRVALTESYDSSSLPFYCSLCDFPTPGPVSYQQHVLGRPHRLTDLGIFDLRDRMALRRKHRLDKFRSVGNEEMPLVIDIE